MYELIEKRITKPKEIDCRYLMPDRKTTDSIDVLILSVSGICPDGSQGSEHAAYISVMALQGLQAFDEDVFILDVRKLEYRWGNSMLGVFQDISQWMDSYRQDDELYFPVLAVTSEKSNTGLLSLVTTSGGKKPDWIFDDINLTIKQAIVRGKEWLDD